MIDLKVTVVGDKGVLAALTAHRVRLGLGAERAVRKATLATRNTASTLAPVRTGTLRRSYHTEFPTPLVGVVGTDLVYARRVEYGFVGVDALGRFYDQAPRAHLGPAFDIHSADFVRDLRALTRGLA